VDSGATVTFIPPELAEAVGLQKVGENESAIGAGGAFLNDIYKFEVQLLRRSDIMYSLIGEAHVPKDEGRIPYVVLGRDGIFEVYDLTFRERKQCLVLKPASGSSNQC
jgi:predicted aspartyl protease